MAGNGKPSGNPYTDCRPFFSERLTGFARATAVTHLLAVSLAHTWGALVGRPAVAAEPLPPAAAVSPVQPTAPTQPSQPTGLGDPGELLAVSIHSGRDAGGPLVLVGSET